MSLFSGVVGYGGGFRNIAFILVIYVLLVIISEVLVGFGGYGVDP